MNISPQSQSMYKELVAAGAPLTAKSLAEKLHIVPSSMYRLAQPLLEMGLISQSDEYPYTYTAKTVDEGLSLFLLQQNDWFMQQFGSTDKKNEQSIKSLSPSQQPKLSFIQSRDSLMDLSAEEIRKATVSVDLLRSGHDIPAHVMYELLEAKKRGVVIRMLVQDYTPENAQHIAAWKKNGIEVRITPLRHIRLMLFDAQNLYFMSYKNGDATKDLGMEISYSPFAVVLSQLFDQWWEKAEEA